tara:strand:+ start:380 stop:523 length:144 start_codon:yes stop_codon:yes gene_type:complete
MINKNNIPVRKKSLKNQNLFAAKKQKQKFKFEKRKKRVPKLRGRFKW